MTRNIDATLPSTCHLKDYLIFRSMHLDWTQHLCMTTGLNFPTGQAQSTESFPGNELSEFLQGAIHLGRIIIMQGLYLYVKVPIVDGDNNIVNVTEPS